MARTTEYANHHYAAAQKLPKVENQETLAMIICILLIKLLEYELAPLKVGAWLRAT